MNNGAVKNEAAQHLLICNNLKGIKFKKKKKAKCRIHRFVAYI